MRRLLQLEGQQTYLRKTGHKDGVAELFDEWHCLLDEKELVGVLHLTLVEAILAAATVDLHLDVVVELNALHFRSFYY